MIPYEDLAMLNKPFRAAFQQKLEEVLERGQFVMGEELEQFEAEFAAYCQTDYAVGTSSGLDALLLLLRGLNLPLGSEVIVPAHTFIATFLAVIHAGLVPVPVDACPQTYNISPEQAEAALTSRTKAILAVHLYGKPAEMETLQHLAHQHGLYLLEDAAQAHGADYQGQKAGNLGYAAAFSFYPTKNLGALGDGGAITTNDKPLYKRLLRLRNYGAKQKYQHKEMGFNARLDELQAAFLRIKLPHLDAMNVQKRRLARLYFDLLDSNKFTLPKESEADVHHIFPVLHPERDRLQAYLKAHQIETACHYPIPPHQQSALQDLLGKQRFPTTERICRQELSLPISAAHTPAQIQEVVAVMNAFT